jgi:hypothetical protein
MAVDGFPHMAKSKTFEDGEISASEADSAPAGRAAIHGNNGDYGDRVAQRAYELYLGRDRADGRDFDDWLVAERELANDRTEDHRE